MEETFDWQRLKLEHEILLLAPDEQCEWEWDYLMRLPILYTSHRKTYVNFPHPFFDYREVASKIVLEVNDG